MKRTIFALAALLAVGPTLSSAGVPGLFLTSGSSGPTGVLLGNNAAPFISGNFAAGWTVAGFGDFDQDGMSDVVMLNPASGDVYLWLDGGLGARPYVGNLGSPSAWSVVAIGDFHGDKRPDIIWQNSSPQSPDFGKFVLWRLRASGGNASVLSSSFLSWPADPTHQPFLQIPLTPGNWRVVGTGDFNGDGTTDLLWYFPPTGQLAAWCMKGAKVISNSQIGPPTAGSTVIGVGDFDGDGTSDVIWYNSGPKTLTVWSIKNSALRSAVNVTYQNAEISFSAFPDWQIVGTGDLNGDGKSDLFLYSATGRGVTGWLMNGSTIPATTAIQSIPLGMQVAGVGQFHAPSSTPSASSWPSPGQPPPTPSLVDPAIAYSPLNWDFSHWNFSGSGYIEATQPGAYFSLNFTGTSAALRIDLTPMNNLRQTYPGIPWPDIKVRYAIDGQTYPDVKLTPDVLNQGVLTLSNSLAPGAHTLKFWYVSNQIYFSPQYGGDRWTPYASVRINGLMVDYNARLLSPAPIRPKNIVFFGDSITDGAFTVNYFIDPATGQFDKSRIADDSDAARTYAASVAQQLDADYGVIGNGGQGWNVPSVGNIPAFYQAWASHSSQAARSFSADVDYVLVNMGTNDFNLAAYVSGCGNNDACLQDYITRFLTVTDPATGAPTSIIPQFLEQLRAKMPDSQVLLMIPFGHWPSMTNVIYAGFNAYQSKYQSKYGQADQKVRLIDLQGLKMPDGTDPSLGLTLSGSTYPNYSSDGVHPTGARSWDLGILLAAQINGAPVGMTTDLSEDSIALPSGIKVGNIVNVSAGVRNIGNKDSTVRRMYYDVRKAGALLSSSSFDLPVIPGGAAYTAAFSFQPVMVGEDYSLTVTINGVDDANLSNNIKTVNFGVSAGSQQTLPVNADVRTMGFPQGSNGWSAGYLANSADSTFGNSDPSSFVTSNMTWNGSSWNGNEAYGTPQITSTFAHPGATTRRSAAWKYVVPAGYGGGSALTFRTALIFGNGTGTSIAIWINNVKVSGYINNSPNFPVTASWNQVLAAGDVVIFELNSRGDASYDSTTVQEITIKSTQ